MAGVKALLAAALALIVLGAALILADARGAQRQVEAGRVLPR